jgi:hypothetical protein
MDHAIALMSRTAPPTLPCTADGTPTRA